MKKKQVLCIYTWFGCLSVPDAIAIVTHTYICGCCSVAGGPFFNEVVFMHKPSKTLFATDIYWNYPGEEDLPFGTRAWKFGMDKVYVPVYHKLMLTNKAAFERAIAKVESWDFDTVVPCHGRVVRDSAKYNFSAHVRRGQITQS